MHQLAPAISQAQNHALYVKVEWGEFDFDDRLGAFPPTI
jgi:hypothetical protein